MRKFNCIVRKNSCYIVVADFNTGSGLKIFEYRKCDNSFHWKLGARKTKTISVPNLCSFSEEEEFQYLLVHDDSLGFTFGDMKEVQKQMISHCHLPKNFVQHVCEFHI